MFPTQIIEETKQMIIEIEVKQSYLNESVVDLLYHVFLP